ncbi:GroES-like protein [Xylariaceae sp. FL0804]|nr:GroES-like protein [Xylariaceae sp. FL0804]
MTSNAAAWIPVVKTTPMEVKAAPDPTPEANEVVVKVEAIGINAIDWMIQTLGDDLFNFIKYPFIGGTDVAGEVVQAGSGIKSVKVGDRVVGLALGFAENDPRQGAFQKLCVLKSHLMTPLPASVRSADAAVLPLGLATAAAGLYQKEYLGLKHPSASAEPTGEAVLIWAGSSSVGSNAIQLAVASGYEVITTCSPKNFDYCKKLGASQAFDYASPTITEELLAAFGGKTQAGAFAILTGSVEPCLEVVHKTKGAKFVAMTLQHQGELPEGVKTGFVFASTIKDNEVGPAVFNNFLPQALAQNKYVCAPTPKVVGTGLEAIQAAFEALKPGVSASKLVVTL